jgi:hypothetical protein
MIPSHHHILDLYFKQAGGRQIVSHQIESFNHFMELIPQLAYLACSKTYSHFSLPDMIIQLLLHFEKATKAKN